MLEKKEFFNHEVHAQNTKIVKEAVSTHVNFQRIIKNYADLDLFAKITPEYADQLMQYVFNNPDEFKRLISNKPILGAMTAAYPQYPFLEYVLRRPEEFKRLFTNPGSFKEYAILYSEYAGIFKQPTIEAAIEAAGNYFKSKDSCHEIEEHKKPYLAGGRYGHFAPSNKKEQELTFEMIKDQVQIPEKYCCAIGFDLMDEPVFDLRAPSYKFDKKNIVKALTLRPLNPFTMESLSSKDLTVDEALKQEIDQFKKQAVLEFKNNQSSKGPGL